MQRRTKALIATAALAAVAAGGTGVAFATGAVGDDDGNEVPITGEALERATEAALTHTGGGTVTETEQGDEESFYEVEVTLDDGRQVDVQLDESFQVVGTEAEDEADDD